MTRILRRPLAVSKEKGRRLTRRLVPGDALRAFEDGAFFLFRN